jgi:methionyl-tRNA formyltransferase
MVKILFFGTAKISEIFLKNLFLNSHELLCISQPDKPAGRGKKIKPVAVKAFAQKNKIAFLQVEKWDIQTTERIAAFGAEVGIAVSFGKLIPDVIFNLPKFRVFNIHFSLLPKYRGAAPVQYAIANGDMETGITAFYIEKTLDTGDILMQEKISIGENDTAGSLFEKLIPLGIEVMNEVLERFKKGDTKAIAQVGEPSFAPPIKKEETLINWASSARSIRDKVRSLYIDKPAAWAMISSGSSAGKRLKIVQMSVLQDDAPINKECGKIAAFEKNKGFVVLCGKGSALIEIVQPENKGIMPACDFLQGGAVDIGDILGEGI